ncbi:hypothetical protein [Hymenobacter terrenus]|uniref:hypothetical protein n=1 Tax=Hymenobacter terrenus TaxID=1629124 RepID=UPI000619A323|nr:hypothetical protein [Hymenobacter terrenus]
MTHYQEDKYENFMNYLRASRSALAAFADFTVAAVGGAEVDAFIGAQLPGLVAARTKFRTGIVTRIAGSGSSQTGTDAEETAFTEFKAFITDTDVRHLQPYFLDHPAAEATFYPDKLSGLTQSPKRKRLARLTAYTQALEGTPQLPTIVVTDGPLQQARTPTSLPAHLATTARALLTSYEAAATGKTKSRTALNDSIVAQGPDFDALAEALWDVHTAALFTHRRDPFQARKYFDYASLPNRSSSTSINQGPQPA